MIDNAFQALTSSSFVDGLMAGAVAMTVVGVAGILSWRLRGPTLPVVGLLWAAACLVVLERAASPLVLGAGLLALAGAIHGRMSGVSWLRPVAAAPGAWLIAHDTAIAGPAWVPWLVFGVVAVGAPLMATGLERIGPGGVVLALWVITVAGVFGTVPDTEEVLVLLGAALALLVLAPLRAVSLGRAGSYPAVGLLAWATAVGGTGRPASIVGGLACVGAFWLVSLPRSFRPPVPLGGPLVLGVHLLVVLISSRVAGLRASVLEAAALALGAHVLGLLLLQLRTRFPGQGPV